MSYDAYKPDISLNKPIRQERKLSIKNLKPIRDVVVIRKLPDLTKTPGGIDLVKGDEQGLLVGEVVAKGPGCVDLMGKKLNETSIIEVGDKVLYSRFANEKIVLGWEHDDYKGILIKDIYGVIDDKE